MTMFTNKGNITGATLCRWWFMLWDDYLAAIILPQTITCLCNVQCTCILSPVSQFIHYPRYSHMRIYKPTYTNHYIPYKCI